MTTEPAPAPAPDVDARGLRCPLPVIRLAHLASGMAPGHHVVVWATDPAAEADIPAWCRMRGHTVTTSARDEYTAYDVVLGSVPG